VAQAVLQYGTGGPKTTLPDQGFAALTPFIPTDAFFADLALFLMDGVAMLRFLVSRRLRYVFLRRRLFIQGVIFVLRAVSISVTPLPNPYPFCQAPAQQSGAGITALLIMLGLVKTCNDVMFSGHAVSITLSALFLYWHADFDRFRGGSIRDSWLRVVLVVSKVVIVIGWMAGLLTVVGTKFHYSLDVFIGALIAALTFLLLYTAIAFVRLFDDDFAEYPPEASLRIAKFISWFEHDRKSDDIHDNGV
jgi:hypothetical protein